MNQSSHGNCQIPPCLLVASPSGVRAGSRQPGRRGLRGWGLGRRADRCPRGRGRRGAGRHAAHAGSQGLELDLDPQANSRAFNAIFFFHYPQVPSSLLAGLEIFFLVIFSAEFLIKFYAYRLALLVDPWSYVDVIAIAVPIFTLSAGQSSRGQAASVLRVFRLFKLLRLVRLVRLFRQLYIIVAGFWSAMKPLMWTSFLLFVLSYTVAILLTMTVGHNDELYSDFHVDCEEAIGPEACDPFVDRRRFFGTIARSMFSLFQVMTGDSWTSIARPVVEGPQPHMLLVFLPFIFLTTFGLLNILIGVLCEHAALVEAEDVAREERIRADAEALAEELALREVFELVDSDGNGAATAAELLHAFETVEGADALRRGKLQGEQLVEIGELISALDGLQVRHMEASQLPDDAGGISFEQFFGIVTRIRTVAQARDAVSSYLGVTKLGFQQKLMRDELLRVRRSQTDTERVAFGIVGDQEQVISQLDELIARRCKGLDCCPRSTADDHG
mmetsp:Transcript_132281/g.300608  ORF Transcript_132281/g.300608 Transcript_132281/m.300608 type:complete len:502 (-) Transcript_132281:260-1765(-)